MEMKLMEFMKFTGKYGFDIADVDFDWGNYFEVPEEVEDDDYYDKCMIFFAENITILNYKENWYSCCKIGDFLMNYEDAFTTFMNEENRYEYRPENFNFKKGDEDWYELYIMTFEGLINGNYAEEDYEKLYTYLTQEA